MRSFYMRIFKNIICIYVLALCCFAYATMIHAIPDHVYVQEGQKLELDKKIPVTLAMSTKPQSVMAQIGERTFQAMKQERAVETCSQLKQGEYTLTCYLFGILPMKEVQVSVVNGKSLYVSGQVVGIYGAAQGVLVLGSGPVETVDGSSRQPAEHIVFPGDYITAVNGKAVTKKEELMERINQYGEQPVVLTLWRGAEQIQVSVEPVEAAEHKGYRLGLWVKDDEFINTKFLCVEKSTTVLYNKRRTIEKQKRKTKEVAVAPGVLFGIALGTAGGCGESGIYR